MNTASEHIFNSKELDTLIEALETWESRDAVGSLFGSLLGSVAGNLSPEAKQEWERKMQEREIEEKREQRQRKEVSTLLKAKIIMLRQSMEVNALITQPGGRE